MVDENKNLYWLDSHESKLLKEAAWRELYSRFGHVFHVAQMMEYNIANILSLEEFEKETKKAFTEADVDALKTRIKTKFDGLSKMTFGGLKTLVKQSKYLKDIDINDLENVVTYRNYLAHHFFKDSFLDQLHVSLDGINKCIDDLCDFEAKTIRLNEWLIRRSNENGVKTTLMEHTFAQKER